MNRLTSSKAEYLGTGGNGMNGYHLPTYTTTYDQTAGLSGSFGNIKTKTDVGTYGYSGFPRHGVATVDNVQNNISVLQQDITYTPFRRPGKVSENDYEQTFTYNPSYQRTKSQLKIISTGATQKTRYYWGNYELNDNATHIYYVPGGDGLCAIVEHNPTLSTPLKAIHYVHKDHLGSILAVTNESGGLQFEQNFDAWGRARNPADWTYNNVPTAPSWLSIGYTGHEHMPQFSLINMNARLYDPLLGKMLGPDAVIHGGSQGYNRFSYAHNNPLSYIDPDGNEPITAAIIIGAVAGAYMGGTMANGGQYNPGKWDYSSGRTWGWMAGGAIMGGISGGVGASIAASGGFMANTMGIIASSYINSVGTHMYTGGRTDVGISFGVGSYSMSKGSFRGIWDWGDLSTMEKIGYTAGALANLQDVVAGFNGSVNETRAEHGGGILHARTKGNGYDISVTHVNDGTYKYPGDNGLLENLDYAREWGTSLDYGEYYGGTATGWKSTLYNVRTKSMVNMSANIAARKSLWGWSNLRYGTTFSGCYGHVARSLLSAGIPTIPFYGFTPHGLVMQLWLRQSAIWVSPVLTNK